MQRLQVVYCKGSEARFLSHLDLLATLEYAMRRSRLPLALAEGFNPRPRMSIALPLPVGYLGEREILEIMLRERREPAEVGELLNSSLPSGLRVLSVEETDAQRRHAASRLQAAVYRIELPGEVPGLNEQVDALLARDRLEVEEAREKGARVRDLRPFILGLRAPGGCLLRLRTALIEGSSVRPEQVVKLLGLEPEGIVITRERIEVS
jgi:radical SAM-linked protein